MAILKLFFNEIKSFSRKNWWLYIIYLILVVIIYLTQKDNLLRVILTSSCHFIADIFIMMMFTAYTQERFKLGSYFQIASMLMFFGIKLVTGFLGGGWHYISADLIYALSAYKNYQLDIKKKDVKFIRPATLFYLSLLIVCGILIPLETCFGVPIFKTFWHIMQTAGIFLFGIALSFTGNERNRFSFSVIALLIMVLGSAFVTANTMIQNNRLSGLELSYALLPLTVLIFYLGKLKMYIKIS